MTRASSDAWTGEVRGTFTEGTHAETAAPTESTTIEVVGDVEGIRALAPDYERLYQVTGNTLPFATQEWHLAWCEHLLNCRPRARQQPLFCVLRQPAGPCVAIVPLILTRWRVGPLKVAAVGLIGADPALTEIRNPLIEPGYESAAVRVVHARLASLSGWDWVEWSGINAALARALALEAAPRWYQTLDDYVLDLPAAWPEFRATLGRNMRRSLWRCYHSLRRDGHTFEFIVARRPEEVRGALSRFLQLHTLRARMSWGPVHPDVFAAPSPRAFLYQVCERLAARDAVRVFQLRIGEAVVASLIGFVIGNSLYFYYSGFDPAWARYSVMTTTAAEALRYAIAGGLESVNLSTIADHTKLRWRPRRVDFHSAFVHRDSVRSRLACAAYRVAVSGRSGPGRLLQRLLRSRRDWS
jgi:CelD/BcsL family acetyltransferase involved in cellulose biosynthesis